MGSDISGAIECRPVFRWVRQGPGLRQVNSKAPNGVQAAVSPHVTFETVLRVKVGLGPLPDCCLIEQFPDCCKVRAKKFCGIILGPSKDADNHVQTHSGTVPVRLTVVAEARYPHARPAHQCDRGCQLSWLPHPVLSQV